MKLFIKLLPDQSPGNSVVLTTAVRDLKRANPDWKLNVGGGAVRDFFRTIRILIHPSQKKQRIKL